MMFHRESKTYLCTSDKGGFFSKKKYDSYTCCTCTELCEAFTFLMKNIYVQFDGMVHQPVVGIHMVTNCAPRIADVFLYCYKRDFMARNQNGLTSYTISTIPLDTFCTLSIYSPLITLNLLSIFPTFIQENIS